MQIIPTDDQPLNMPCDALVVGAFSTDDGLDLADAGRAVDEALEGSLLEHLTEIRFKARPGDVAVVATLRRLPAKSIVVTGLGQREDLDAPALRQAAGAAARRLSQRRELVCALGQDGAEESAAVAEGVLLGSYAFAGYKKEPKVSRLERVAVVGGDEAGLDRGMAMAEAANTARDLINEPSNSLTPEALARKAKELADVAGISCEVADETALEEGGFGGILGVAKGSHNPSRLIKLTYEPAKSSGKLALVGKGVTYDSGGLSLKDLKGLEQMKTDMSGAAAVINAICFLPRLDLPIAVTAYVPAVENMPSGHATKPGDVLHHYGGRTTEVLNTDAEGRLILADALARAAEDEPDAIVDVATLTGSMVIALGSKLGGLFANRDDLAHELLTAAVEAGEPLWHMPLFGDYRKTLESEVADHKNIGGRFGGGIIAALFLEDFVPSEIPWAHLDIAGTARSDSDEDLGPKGGTGVATRTLIRWIWNRSR